MDLVEKQVRHELNRRLLVRTSLKMNLLFYLAYMLLFTIFFLAGAYAPDFAIMTWPATQFALVWTLVVFIHAAYYHYFHGRGKTNREALIAEEVARRRLMEPKLKNDLTDEASLFRLGDDGEIESYFDQKDTNDAAERN